MKTLVIYLEERDLLALCERTGKQPKDFTRVDGMQKGEGFRDCLVITLPRFNWSFRNAGEFIATKRSLERRGCVFVSVGSEALKDRAFNLAAYLESVRPK